MYAATRGQKGWLAPKRGYVTKSVQIRADRTWFPRALICLRGRGRPLHILSQLSSYQPALRAVRKPGGSALTSMMIAGLPASYGYRTQRKGYEKQLLQEQLPPGCWDSHMHVVEPRKFPLSLGAQYCPSTFSLLDAQQFEETLGVHGVVIVQPSIYGTDNSCLLAALREAGPLQARGVIVCEPASTSQQQLREWHEQGVRGVRINLESDGGRPGIGLFIKQLEECADMIRPLGWVLDLYLPMKLLSSLEPVLKSLDVRICLDHFGSPMLPSGSSLQTQLPTPFDPYTVGGFDALVRLASGKHVWVKFSGAYRLAKNTGQKDMLQAIGRELLRRAPSQVVWASDWPHTRYEGTDVRPFALECVKWCGGNETLKDRLFRDNASKLWS